MDKNSCDYLIVGGGVLGLAIARALKLRNLAVRVILLEKENEVAAHASGRNSGVIHAGFYYTADSLKARFTRDGNQQMHAFCEENKLRINRCGKTCGGFLCGRIDRIERINESREAQRCGIGILSVTEVEKIEPNVRTVEVALYSPTTSTVDPIEVCNCLARIVLDQGVELKTGSAFLGLESKNVARVSTGNIEFGCLINTAGLYADRIAQIFGFCKDKTILPFKSLYLKYEGSNKPVRTNVYPLPSSENPFLGVHFTVTVDGSVKIGPTATPAFTCALPIAQHVVNLLDSRTKK